MQVIVDFLAGLGNFFVTIGNFFVTFFRDLGYLVLLTGNMLVNVTGYLSWLPLTLAQLLTIAITIAIVYKIMGRE